jgi:DNA-binding NtrC family response regulator
MEASGVAPALLGDSAVMRQLRREIDRVARLHVTVLIEGERGTGKTLVARAIHQASPRQDGPFVTVACAHLEPMTAASEFFGHRRDVVQGTAEDRLGVFESASGGTLLLDGVGQLPLGSQGHLLRVVEERVVRRVGETDPRPVDVRLLATTDRDLVAETEAGYFREDLLYRIRIARVHVPPLDSRREDIPLLADAFCRRACVIANKRVHAISPRALQHLLTRPWRGHVAELKATIEAAVLRCAASVLELENVVPDPLDEGVA